MDTTVSTILSFVLLGAVAASILVAGILHFVVPRLGKHTILLWGHGDSTEHHHNNHEIIIDEDHLTQLVLIVTDAPHVFLSLATAIIRVIALDKKEEQLQQQSASSSSSPTRKQKLLAKLLLTFSATSLLGYTFYSQHLEYLFVPMTYVAILHNISQIVFTVQEASVSASRSMSRQKQVQEGEGGQEPESPNNNSKAITVMTESPSTLAFWWLPTSSSSSSSSSSSFSSVSSSFLRLFSSLDALLTFLLCLCPIAVWFMDVDRGLDWFHWELVHLFQVPRAALPFIVFIATILTLVLLLRLFLFLFSSCSSSSSNRLSPFLTRGNALGALTAIVGVGSFAAGILSTDRDLSVPFLAIPHAAVSMTAYTLLLLKYSPTVFPNTSPIMVLGLFSFLAVFWGFLERALLDITFQDEAPETTLTYLMFGMPQLLHLVVDPARAAWSEVTTPSSSSSGVSNRKEEEERKGSFSV